MEDDPQEVVVKLDDGQVLAAVSSVKLPTPFWRSNPRRYFTVAEMKFDLHKITSDNMKFRHIVSNLDADVLDIVGSLIDNPPDTGKYQALKTKLISTLSESSEARVRRLLRGQPLGEDKPTIFLQKIRQLLGEESHQPGMTTIMRSLFLEQMPDPVKTVLAGNPTDDLDALALQANSVLDVLGPQIFETTARINAVDKAATAEKENAALRDEIQEMKRELSNRMDQLSIRVDQISRGRSHSRERNRRPRSSSRDGSKTALCYYHEVYGGEARKCRAPCAWKKEN